MKKIHQKNDLGQRRQDDAAPVRSELRNKLICQPYNHRIWPMMTVYENFNIINGDGDSYRNKSIIRKFAHQVRTKMMMSVNTFAYEFPGQMRSHPIDVKTPVLLVLGSIQGMVLVLDLRRPELYVEENGRPRGPCVLDTLYTVSELPITIQRLLNNKNIFKIGENLNPDRDLFNIHAKSIIEIRQLLFSLDPHREHMSCGRGYETDNLHDAIMNICKEAIAPYTRKRIMEAPNQPVVNLMSQWVYELPVEFHYLATPKFYAWERRLAGPLGQYQQIFLYNTAVMSLHYLLYWADEMKIEVLYDTMYRFQNIGGPIGWDQNPGFHHHNFVGQQHIPETCPANLHPSHRRVPQEIREHRAVEIPTRVRTRRKKKKRIKRASIKIFIAELDYIYGSDGQKTSLQRQWDKSCFVCASRYHNLENCPQVAKNKFVPCSYPLCFMRHRHSLLMCPSLHAICPQCKCRGHRGEKRSECQRDRDSLRLTYMAYKENGLYTYMMNHFWTFQPDLR